MAILDSINTARQRGASDDQILAEIAKKNPAKRASFDTAIQRGAAPSAILDEIIKQNSTKAPAEAPAVQESGVGSKVMDFLGKVKNVGRELSTGAVKGLMSGSTGLVQGLAALSGGIEAAVKPNLTYKDVKELQQKEVAGTIFEGLISGTPEAERQKEQLAPTNKLQAAGRYAEMAAEFLLTGGTKSVVALNKGIANSLQKSTFRLSGTQQRELGEKLIQRAADTARKLKIAGTPQTRYEKATEVYEGLENTLKSFLKSPEVRKIKVDRAQLVKELNNVAAQFKNDREYIPILKQIKGMIKRVEKMPQKIALDDLNELKRSTFKQAYTKKGTEVRDDVEFALGDVLKEKLETTLKGKGLTIDGKSLDEFNAGYSEVINLRNILHSAIGKQELGVLPRIIGFTGGSALGYSTGSVAGGIAGGAFGPTFVKGVMGTAPKSYLANFFENLSKIGAKGGEAVDTLKTLGKNIK